MSSGTDAVVSSHALKNTRGPRGEKSVESVGHSRSVGEFLLSINGDSWLTHMCDSCRDHLPG